MCCCLKTIYDKYKNKYDLETGIHRHYFEPLLFFNWPITFSSSGVLTTLSGYTPGSAKTSKKTNRCFFGVGEGEGGRGKVSIFLVMMLALFKIPFTELRKVAPNQSNL